MSNPLITLQDFIDFKEFFYKKTGILFEENKRYFVDKRLQERLAATGTGSVQSYLRLLRQGGLQSELQHLTNSMTVNETYFFRESYQFDCLVHSMLPEICATKHSGDTIRIWSIPASTGEEPYSIVMYLLEYWPSLANYNVEIYASDIDSKVLTAAQQGIYSERSLQALPLYLLQQYFQRRSDGQYQISAELRESVHFSLVNLNDPAQTQSYQHMDVIFCRNLLIYFDDVSRRSAAQTFFNALNPGGFICLGHSESMSRISALFKIRHFPDAFVYQKPSVGAA